MESKTLFTIKIKTTQWQDLIVITEDVKKLIKSSHIEQGLCFLFSPHSTAGLTINSFLDPDTGNDLNFEMNRLVPTRVDFQHVRDTPTDAAGHIKSSLIGTDLTLIIENGDLLLGRSQGIFFWEFDGPREREIKVKIIAG